jgi:hypothetical protein
MEGASIYLMSVRKINDLSGVAWAPYRGVVEGAFFDCTAFRSEYSGKQNGQHVATRWPIGLK